MMGAHRPSCAPALTGAGSGGSVGAVKLQMALVMLAVASAGRAAVGGALEDSPSARWAGMGGAARAAATDAHAGLLNPANLAAQGPVTWQVASRLSLATLDRTTGSLAASFQSDRSGTYAVAWVHRATAGLERVDDQGNLSGTESSSEDALAVSGGWAPLYRVRAGITAKLLHHALMGYAGTGGAVDAGVTLLPWLGTDLVLALTGENLAGAVHWDTGAADVPARALAVGAGWRTWRERILVTSDAVQRQARAGVELHGGAEVWPVPMAAVRAGWDNGRLAAGASYRLKPYEFDYAFAFDPDRLNSRHEVSFQLVF